MGFRASGTPNFLAAHPRDTVQNVDMPAASAGDLLILFAVRATHTVTWTVPDGWTSVPALMGNRVSTDTYSTFFAYRIAAGDEGASVGLTNSSGNSATANQSAVIVAYESPGFDVTPVSGHRTLVSDTNVPTSPAITTVTDGATVVLFQSASNAEITAAAAPTGYTLRVSHSPHDDANIFVADITAGAAGTVTPTAWGHTYSAQYSDGTVVTIALQPPPSPVIVSVDGDNSISQGQQDIQIIVNNIPSGNVPVRAGAGGTNGVGGTDFTGFNAVAGGTAGSFTITADVPIGIATSSSVQCYVEYEPE